MKLSDIVKKENRKLYQRAATTYDNMQLVVYDTTLRDGRQDPRISMSNETRLQLVPLLDKFGVDYIELGWPVNEDDVKCFQQAQKLVQNSKIVAFCSTRKITNSAEEDPLLNLVLKTGVEYATIFGKTWEEHVEKQLKATKEQNLQAISESIEYLKKNKLTVFFDAEHFFDGYKDNKKFALDCLDAAIDAGASTVILCDTNGGCMPNEIAEITMEVKKYLDANHQDTDLGIHCHNDTGCAIANTNIAIKEGAAHIQGTVGGIGERAGNADLCVVLPNAVYKQKYQSNIDLSKLSEFNREMHELLGIESNKNQPYVGEAAFAHNGGIHVDAVIKGASYNHLKPELVGNISKVCLTNNSGRAAIVQIVKDFGYDVKKDDPKVKQMLREVHKMTNQGYNISILGAEHYLLTQRFFGNYQDMFAVTKWSILTEKDKDSICELSDAENNKVVKEDIKGGPVDAAYKAIKKLINNPVLENVHLVHYGVEIPKAGSHEEESTVNVYITFKNGSEEWTTVGNDPNILEASIEAISKGFRYYLLKTK
jgi:2-isopropylmalate synthase